MLENTLFYIFAAGAIISGLWVVISRSAVHGTLWLVLTMCFTAGLFVLLDAFFVAAVQVLVYAGAILVLFLFVVMLMDIRENAPFKLISLPSLLAVAVSLLLLAELVLVITRVPSLIPSAGIHGVPRAIGLAIFSKYTLPFELTAFMLLSSVVSIVILAKKDNHE